MKIDYIKSNTHLNFNKLFVIIFLIYLKEGNSRVTFKYPSAITLPNNNYFIVEKNGIYIYNKDFIFIRSYDFDTNEKINDLSELSEILIRLQNNYLICFIKSKIYFFDNTGNLLAKISNIIVDSSYTHPTIAPIYVKSNYYYFVLGYFIPTYKLKLIYYKIDLQSFSLTKVDDAINDDFESYYYIDYDFRSKGLSCEYMLDDYKYEYYLLICFLIIKDGNHDDLTQSYYQITDSSIDWTGAYKMSYIETDDIKNGIQIKSVTSKNLRFAIISVLFSTNNLKYYLFRFEWGNVDKFGKFYETGNTNFNCRASLYAMKLNYLENNNNIVLSCINSGSTVQAMMFTDGLTKISSNNQFSFCESIYGHSVLYSAANSEYYVISDVQCGKYIRSYEPLVGELSEIIETTILIVTTQPIIVTETITEKIIEKLTEIQTEQITDEITEELTEEITEKIEKEKEERSIEKENIEEDLNYENEKENLSEKEEEEKTVEKEIETDIYKEEEKEVIEETIKSSEISTTFISLFNCSDLIKCSICNEESYNKKLCIECNNLLGFYYLNKNPNSFRRNKYIDCVNEETKPSNFYFNSLNQDYEMCYTTCATCKFFGDDEKNNCTTCDEEIYTKYREEENSTNCVVKCKYYITDSNIRQCIKECPDEYNLFIEEVNKCIDDCKKDREYKYRYNGRCYKRCPNNTLDDNDYICKDIQTNKCFLSINEINYLNENFTIDKAESLTIKYAGEFSYTDNHVSQYKDSNDIYRLTIYINSECISELKLQIPEIDFKNCSQHVKDFYQINDNENIIIAIIDKKIQGTNIRKIISHGMFYLTSGKYLNPNDICKEEKILFVESVEDKLMAAGIKLELYQDMAKEGIDLFDLSSPFYNDVCFQYNSTKDIALKDRVLVYFPNISLCDDNCELKGVNTTSLEAICECLYADTQHKDALKENALVKSSFGDIEELINSINIYVLKCVKLLTKVKNIDKCYGGFIILSLLLIQIVYVVIYCSKSLYHINKYVFGVINNYLKYLQKEENNSYKRIIKNKSKTVKVYNSNKNNAPPNSKEKHRKFKYERNYKKKSINKSIKNHINFYFNNDQDKNKEQSPQIENNNNKNIKNNDILLNKKNNVNSNEFLCSSKGALYKGNSISILQLKNDLDINFEEYLEMELENMDYYEAIKKDKRTFCSILGENITSNQMIINTFCMDEPLKPKPIKILLLTLQIDLYLFVNGLFFDEEYISKIFHLEEDNLSSILERFLENLLYATLVGVIVGYIIELFFVEEQKIKNILKIENENILVMQYETIKIMKSIKTRYILFIIISLLISVFTIIHISCFNIVYHHTTMEWLIFSFIIIVLIQLFSVLVCFLQSLLRFISLKYKSEKIYKLSLLMSEFL